MLNWGNSLLTWCKITLMTQPVTLVSRSFVSAVALWCQAILRHAGWIHVIVLHPSHTRKVENRLNNWMNTIEEELRAHADATFSLLSVQRTWNRKTWKPHSTDISPRALILFQTSILLCYCVENSQKQVSPHFTALKAQNFGQYNFYLLKFLIGCYW